MKLKYLAVLALFATLFFVACGGGGGEEESAQPESVTIQVTQSDNYFGATPDNATNPPKWNVNAGGQVSIELTNNGTTEHNWAVIKLDADMPEAFDTATNSDLILKETGLVAAGESFRESFFAPSEAGEYLVICTVAGHYPSMQGRLVVN
ncbi:MAG: cupredoxin domain-containing protein [Anaerolineae bacterium]|jgi:plastocyanin|nr:cupredoxin domain-containing protein [Anaerolineae bacterium]